MIGKVKQVIVMEIYGPEGEFLGRQAKYIYKPLLTRLELIAGLILAFLAATQIFN